MLDAAQQKLRPGAASSRLSRSTTEMGGTVSRVSGVASQLTSDSSSPIPIPRRISSSSVPIRNWLPPAMIAVGGSGAVEQRRRRLAPVLRSQLPLDDL